LAIQSALPSLSSKPDAQDLLAVPVVMAANIAVPAIAKNLLDRIFLAAFPRMVIPNSVIDLSVFCCR
jgi:hypothetical protein